MICDLHHFIFIDIGITSNFEISNVPLQVVLAAHDARLYPGFLLSWSLDPRSFDPSADSGLFTVASNTLECGTKLKVDEGESFFLLLI